MNYHIKLAVTAKADSHGQGPSAGRGPLNTSLHDASSSAAHSRTWSGSGGGLSIFPRNLVRKIALNRISILDGLQYPRAELSLIAFLAVRGAGRSLYLAVPP